MDKPRVGFFSMSSCSGCQLAILSKPQSFVGLSSKMEIKAFRTIDSLTSDETLDIAVIEGSIGSEQERAKAEEIRKMAKRVIALGACACLGGVQSNGEDFKPLHQVIEIDNKIRGCPVDALEFSDILIGLIIGRRQEIRETSVCMDCREKSTKCIIEDGGVCLGPSSYSGCRAICPRNQTWCLGCRGMTRDSNEASLSDVLKSRRDISKLSGIFGGPDDKH